MSLKVFIGEIKFRNEVDPVKLNNDDIVVFVGPNGAGKSQTIKDILGLASDVNFAPKVVERVGFCMRQSMGEDFRDATEQEVKDYVTQKCEKKVSECGETVHGYFDFSISDTDLNAWHFGKSFEKLCGFFCHRLSTKDRLEIFEPSSEIGASYLKVLAAEKGHLDAMSCWFDSAFQEKLVFLNDGDKKSLRCVSRYFDGPESDILSNSTCLEEEGDGKKSFAAAILPAVLDSPGMFYFDEPEAFLHPPQARALGKFIALLTGDRGQQVFVATHSPDFLRGLVECGKQRVKVVRLTRSSQTTNTVSVLDGSFASAWHDSFLMATNMMESLFHPMTVMCESDSDCLLYARALTAVLSDEDRPMEAFFIGCGGKRKQAKLVPALKALNLPFRLIFDFDLLLTDQVLKELCASVGVEWSIIEPEYKRFQNAELLMRDAAKRRRFKKFGLRAASEEGRTAICKMLHVLQAHSVFIVPCGELESFYKHVGGHGPEFVDKVIGNIKLGMDREVQRGLGKDDAEVDKPLLDFVRTWKV